MADPLDDVQAAWGRAAYNVRNVIPYLWNILQASIKTLQANSRK